MMRIGLLIAEMRRRRVFRTGGLFLIGAWVAIQVASEVVGPLGLPDWTINFIVWAAVIGFPVALVLGWRYEVGIGGITRTAPATGAPIDLSLRPSDYLILLVFVGVIVAVTYGIVSPTFNRSGSSVVLDVAEDRTLAVLPFMTDDSSAIAPDLVDGFVDQLRDHLSRVSGLRTGARGSSNAFRAGLRDYVAIAGQLRVRLLIDGSIRRDAEVVCASIEIIEGATGFLRPGGSHDVCEVNYVALQQSVTNWIVRELLPDAEPTVAAALPGSQGISAQEAMLLGDSLFNKVRDDELVDVEALDRAIAWYRRAVDLDPSAVFAHQRLASALLYRGELDEAFEHITTALRLSPDLADVQKTFGDYYFAIGSGNAGTSWRRAVELNPNNADALAAYALWLWLKSEYSEPEQYYRRAIELDPLTLRRYADFGEFLGTSGRVEETLELADQIQERFPNARGYRRIARLNELVGRNDHAIAWALRALALEPNNDDLRDQLAELYYRIGDMEAGQQYESGPFVGLLFLRREYETLIDVAEEIMLDEPATELNLVYLLAFAYGALNTPNPEHMVWLLDTWAGLPDAARREAYESISVQASVYMIRALYDIGREAEAVGHAEWFIKFAQRGIDTGGELGSWSYAYMACALAGIGRDDEALEHLEYLPEVPGLVLYPMLRDALCFRHLRGNARYETVVDQIDRRMAGYRERLPETLRAYGLVP